MKISLIEQERISVAFFSNQHLLSFFTLLFSSYLLQHMRTQLFLCRDILEMSWRQDVLTTILRSELLSEKNLTPELLHHDAIKLPRLATPALILQQESLPFICLSPMHSRMKIRVISTNKNFEFGASMQQHGLSFAVQTVLHPPAGRQLPANYK